MSRSQDTTLLHAYLVSLTTTSTTVACFTTTTTHTCAVQVVVRRPGGVACHPGGSEVLQLEEDTGRIISAGRDGCVRYWDALKLSELEAPEDSVYAEIEPMAEVSALAYTELRLILMD